MTVASTSTTSLRARRGALGIALAGLMALAALIASLAVGAVAIPPEQVVAILLHGATGGATDALRDAIVVWDIRLPRALLGMMVGAATALSGAVMQGLFRNPLADPGITGISSGAALAAATWIVFGTTSIAFLPAPFSGYGLPLAAFVGGPAMTFLLHPIATQDGRTSVITLLLAGIPLTASPAPASAFSSSSPATSSCANSLSGRSALAGAATLLVADLVARTIAAPAELPLGILTAGIGGPIMLWLVVNRRHTLLG